MTVKVEAIDGSSDQTLVSLRILDVNDNLPKFQTNKTTYYQITEENAKGLPKHLSKVSLPDHELFFNFIYEMYFVNNMYRIWFSIKTCMV